MRSINIFLTQAVPHYQYLRERLKAEFPDADEETLQDTLEGLSNLTEMIAAVLRSRLDDLDLAKALRDGSGALMGKKAAGRN